MSFMFVLHSTETINDGQFHTVELVTFDQMVNLSIDGGIPTTMDSFGKVQPLRGEAPLYVGGRSAPRICAFITVTINVQNCQSPLCTYSG